MAWPKTVRSKAHLRRLRGLVAVGRLDQSVLDQMLAASPDEARLPEKAGDPEKDQEDTPKKVNPF